LTKKKTEGFQEEWLEIYKWLVYDSSKNLMFCSLCKSHKKLNKFGKAGNRIFLFYLVCNEWFSYKAIVHSNFKNIKIEALLPRLFEFYYDTFPNIIKLLGIIYSIPFSSVDCEHGFSKQNLIKTDLRNSLNNETLHFWMIVGLEQRDLSEFDFTRALQIWNGACKRRI
jgi:hypothetical protein